MCRKREQVDILSNEHLENEIPARNNDLLVWISVREGESIQMFLNSLSIRPSDAE